MHDKSVFVIAYGEERYAHTVFWEELKDQFDFNIIPQTKIKKLFKAKELKIDGLPGDYGYYTIGICHVTKKKK